MFGEGPQECPETTLTLQMFSINILCFMSSFSFNGDTLYRLIPSGGIDLFIPPESLMGDTISRTPARTISKSPGFMYCLHLTSSFHTRRRRDHPHCCGSETRVDDVILLHCSLFLALLTQSAIVIPIHSFTSS